MDGIRNFELKISVNLDYSWKTQTLQILGNFGVTLIYKLNQIIFIEKGLVIIQNMIIQKLN